MKRLPSKLKVESLPIRKDENRFSDDNAKPEHILRFFDPTGDRTWSYVVIDNTKRGPGLGGIRMVPDVTLPEVKRLARVMTLKNSVSRLPYGGGKAGLLVDPETFLENPDARTQLFSQFSEALFPLEGYIPAPDMGTNENDVQCIYECFSKKLGTLRHGRGGASRPEKHGGIPIDDWGLTAHGLFAAARTLEEFKENFSIQGCRVVIQGYGNVGSWIGTKLAAAGAIVVGASDINTALWHPYGLDIRELNAVRRKPGGLAGYSGLVTRRFPQLGWLLEAPCDLLIPAARPDAITSRNADRIQCRYILQGANTPSNKMTEYYLQNRRGILSLSDFIVNVGGVIGCAVELQMTLNENFHSKVCAYGAHAYLEDRIYRTVAQNVSEIFQRLAANNYDVSILREVALLLEVDSLTTGRESVWL